MTKKCTGSSTSLVYKLLTMYRPGGEQEKTLLLEQLTTPEGVTTPDLAVQALRKCGRWFSRAKDLTVTVPDPVLMVKGLATIVGPVLTKNQDVWLRTTMMRNRLQLDSNPTESTTLDYHRHPQAETELLCTASTTSGRAPPKLKAAMAADSAGVSSATTARQKPEKKDKPCRWFGKSEEGCKKGMDCPFQHDWGGFPRLEDACCAQRWDIRRRTAPQRSQPMEFKLRQARVRQRGKGRGRREHRRLQQLPRLPRLQLLDLLRLQAARKIPLSLAPNLLQPQVLQVPPRSHQVISSRS